MNGIISAAWRLHCPGTNHRLSSSLPPGKVSQPQTNRFHSTYLLALSTCLSKRCIQPLSNVNSDYEIRIHQYHDYCSHREAATNVTALTVHTGTSATLYSSAEEPHEWPCTITTTTQGLWQPPSVSLRWARQQRIVGSCGRWVESVLLLQ